MILTALLRAASAFWAKLNSTPGSPPKPASAPAQPPKNVTVVPPPTVSQPAPKPQPQPSPPVLPITSVWSCLLPYEYDDAANTSWYCNFDWQKDFIGTDQSRYLGKNNEFVDKLSDTNLKYGEKALKPRSEGWDNWLGDQMARCVKSGKRYIELDNADYALERDRSVVMETYKLANSLGLAIVLKNPTARDVVEFGRLNIAGAVFEQGALSPLEFAAARKSVVPTMQATWVRHGGNINGQDIPEIASQVREVPGTSVQWGPGEYNGMRIVASNPFQAEPIPAAAPAPTPAPTPAPRPPTASNFERCVKLVLVHEGGNDDDPHDPGGRTSRGITAGDWAEWRKTHPGLPSDVWQAPQDQIIAIYRLKYWDGMQCDKIAAGLDYAVFDCAVLEGLGRARPWLNDVATMETRSAINKFCDLRLAHLQGLSGWSNYGHGWGTRVADVRHDALAMVSTPASRPATTSPTLPSMLILRGIAGTFAGKDYPHGALDEPSALEYAKRHGYAGRVLDVSGETGPTSAQVLLALREFRRDPSVAALYGFSGGGYNLKHILTALTANEKQRIKLVVVLGAPNNPESVYAGPWELVYRTDPPTGHMDGPHALLNETVPIAPPKPVPHPDAPELHDLGHRIKRTMLAKAYPWFDDQNVVSVEKMNPDGSPCLTGPNTFDDIKMMLDGDGKIVGGPWEATTHPGKLWTIEPMNPHGAFIIALGPQAVWTPGEYHGHEVWRQAEDSNIMGHRDPHATYKRQGEPQPQGNAAVHHHGGYNLPKGDIKNAAAGCQVIRLTDKQEEFMRLTKKCPRYLADPHGYRLTATVLEAKDILL